MNQGGVVFESSGKINNMKVFSHFFNMNLFFYYSRSLSPCTEIMYWGVWYMPMKKLQGYVGKTQRKPSTI